MTKNTSFFIIRFFNDEHGMRGTFSSVQEAVDHINRYYRDSKAKGVDCKKDRWIVVRVESFKVIERGELVFETIGRTTVARVSYSKTAGEYVSEEVHDVY